MVKLAEEVRVVDADTHMTERHDLFTSRAPKGYVPIEYACVEGSATESTVGTPGADVSTSSNSKIGSP